MSRDRRQFQVIEWARRVFGPAAANNSGERVRRFLEEAIELAQAEGLDKAGAAALLDHVYAKPAGEVRQEVGGVGVTLLAYCEAAGLSAEECEIGEFIRVLAIPADHFRARHNAKAVAGVALPVTGEMVKG